MQFGSDTYRTYKRTARKIFITYQKIRHHTIKSRRYQQIAEELGAKKSRPQGSPARLFLKIGKTIKETRIEKGWSQNELALRAGMKHPDISRIEEGRRNITLETLTRLCKILEVAHCNRNFRIVFTYEVRNLPAYRQAGAPRRCARTC